ncbi:MAG TPA: DUF5076 domain-containing protein [Polyangia bacterium]|nr:DUF5076 domain-containing protein [Polyangia bacterium]
MSGGSRGPQGIEPPPVVAENPRVTEVLRVWAEPGRPQYVALRPVWKDPAAWGLVLVDVARHVARAYEREGRDPAEVLKRIRQFFDAEWTSPTALPADPPPGRQ